MKIASKCIQAVAITALLGTNLAVHAQENEEILENLLPDTLELENISDDSDNAYVKLVNNGPVYINDNEASTDTSLIQGNKPVSFIDSAGDKVIVSNYDKPAGSTTVLILDQGFEIAEVTQEINALFRAAKFAKKVYNPERIGAKALKKLMELCFVLPKNYGQSTWKKTAI